LLPNALAIALGAHRERFAAGTVNGVSAFSSISKERAGGMQREIQANRRRGLFQQLFLASATMYSRAIRQPHGRFLTRLAIIATLEADETWGEFQYSQVAEQMP
jgi:hypothetical protein